MILRVLLTSATLLLLTVAASVGAAASAGSDGIPITRLENVRSYTAATSADGRSYAVDSGRLHVGVGGGWQPVRVPPGVIVSAVAVDRLIADTVYIGAANGLSIFVSRNAGQDWLEVPMDSDAIGGVTDLAFDAFNRLLYVGTDTDGVHRLRDVGARMDRRVADGRDLIASGHLLLDEPVEEIATDSTGAGMAFVRTRRKLYRAESFGLRWVVVDGLPGPATAVAVADTAPPTVYAGTAGGGVLKSRDGVGWRPVNRGLGRSGSSQLVITDLAVDPAQTEVVYASTGLPGGGGFDLSAGGVAMTVDGGGQWTAVAGTPDAQVVELLPVTGRTGAVYALTTASRTPLALGAAPLMETKASETSLAPGLNITGLLAWILAGHASAALIIMFVTEVARGRREAADIDFSMGAAQLG